jgi:hypothetical protein
MNTQGPLNMRCYLHSHISAFVMMLLLENLLGGMYHGPTQRMMVTMKPATGIVGEPKD